MANTQGLLSGFVGSIPNCTVCMESYKEPKVLPTCDHTFCLECLEQYGQDQQPGEKLNCPECEKEFEIPCGGLRGLSNNYIILESLKNYINLKSPNNYVNLESPNNYINVESTQLNPISNQNPNGEMLSSVPEMNGCDQHPGRSIEFYCYDCKTIACIVCYKAQHMKHKCADVNDEGIKFDLLVKEEVEKVTPLIVNCKDELKLIEEEKKSLTRNVNMRKVEISKTYDLCKSFLDSDTLLLMYELKSYQEKTLEELKARKAKLEANLQSLENFKSYCEKLEEKCPTVNEISQEAFHVRSDEIVKICKEFAITPLNSVDVEFLPLSPANRENWIGQLKFNCKH